MSGIIQISEAALLALHSIMIIAAAEDKPTRTKEIAALINASENHLAKVMQRLVKAGMVTSIRGPHGGFLMAKKTDEITLLDVYEALEGKIQVHKCMINNSECPFKGCIFGDLNTKLSNEFIQALGNRTLESLL